MKDYDSPRTLKDMKKYNFEEDRFYSVSEEDMILDDLLERAFSEGYEYAQKEFANKHLQRVVVKTRRGIGKILAKGGNKMMNKGRELNLKAWENGKDGSKIASILGNLGKRCFCWR